MIKHENRNLYRHEIEAELELQGITTLDGALTQLFDPDGDQRSSYAIRHKWPQKPKQKLIHRINELWVYPLFVLCIPLRYVILGHYQVSDQSRLGKTLLWLLGVLK